RARMRSRAPSSRSSTVAGPQSSSKACGPSRKLCATGRSSTAMASARTQRTTWCSPGRSRVRSMAGSTRAGSARQDDLRLLAVAAVERGSVADALHQLGAAAARQFGDGGVAGLPVLGGDLHLDQFVVLQGTIHF